MPQGEQVVQATTWVNLLANMDQQPRLIGILQSSPFLAHQYSAFCHINGFKSFSITLTPDRQLTAETIAASGCDVLICDQAHYELLIYILSLQNKPMTVILNQECWTPDWCWQLPQHHFLCLQDIE